MLAEKFAFPCDYYGDSFFEKPIKKQAQGGKIYLISNR
jgi:hypothetical protein